MSSRWSELAVRLLASLLLLAGCSTASMAGESETRDDLRRFTPVEFLEFLKTDTRPMRVYTVGEPVRCWVTQDDIPELMARLDSNEKSMSVALAVVSNIRREAREADEAAYLIEGFRYGKYPPTLGSVAVDAEKVSEIRTWWISYEAGLAPRVAEAEQCAER